MESRLPALVDGEDDKFIRAAVAEFDTGDAASAAAMRLDDGGGAVSDEPAAGKDAPPGPMPPALDTVTFADLLAAQDLAPDFFAPTAQPANDTAPATTDDAPAPVPPTVGLATLTPSEPVPLPAQPADEVAGVPESPTAIAAAALPVEDSTPLLADDGFAHERKPQSLTDALDAVARLEAEAGVLTASAGEAAPNGNTLTPAPPAAAGSAWDEPSPVPPSAPASQGNGQPLTSALGAAAKLAADANAAAEALENLKRLLERQLPDVSAGLAAPAPLATGAAWSAPAPEAPRPPPLPPRASSAGEDRHGIRYPQPAPEPHVPVPRRRPAAERSRFDVRGFLAGFAISWAFGVVLYLFMAAG